MTIILYTATFIGQNLNLRILIFFSDSENLKLSKQKIEELKLNGDIELKGLLLADQEKLGSDDDNEEYELNVHGQR